MIAPTLLLAAVLADLDFSPTRPGAVYDRAHPNEAPVCVRTVNCYGRRLGNALALNPRLEYPRYALGRDGKLSAVRFGNALASIPGSVPDCLTGPKTAAVPLAGKPSTQILWFYVYDQPVMNGGCRLIESQFGYKFGFRIDYGRYAGWAEKGVVGITYGDGKTSKSIGTLNKKEVLPGCWHQLAVVNDGGEMEFFLDGDSMGSAAGGFLSDGKHPLVVRFAVTSDRFCWKTDSYRLYGQALSGAEIAADWKTGQPVPAASGDEASACAAMPRLEPHRYGYYETGEEISVVVNGQTVDTFTFDKPGLTEIEHGGVKFPLGIVRKRPDAAQASSIGAVDLMNQQPELTVLGVRRTLVKVPWWLVESVKTEYDWTALDITVDACERAGVKPILTLWGEPAWYTKDPVANMPRRDKMVKLFAARYDGAKVVEFEDVKMIGFDSLEKCSGINTYLSPPVPCWQGVCSDAFAGYPHEGALTLADFLLADGFHKKKCPKPTGQHAR